MANPLQSASAYLTVEGKTGGDLLWLTDFFKSTGLNAEYISVSKKQLFQQVTDAIEQGELAVVGVKWQGGGAHWLLAVGHQGVAQVKDQEAELQPTHLLCLDPGQETPKTSLWNAVQCCPYLTRMVHRSTSVACRLSTGAWMATKPSANYSAQWCYR